MTYKEIIGKLTPAHFRNGESFDMEAFASLKEAIPKQRRNTIILTIVGTIMLIASLILAFTVGGVPVIPCWLIFLVLALTLKTKKWSKQLNSAKQTLGVTRKDIKNAIRNAKNEYLQAIVEAAAAPFAKEGLDKSIFNTLLAQKRGFWKMPVFWIVMFSVGFGIISGIVWSIIGEAIQVEYISGDGLKIELSLIICVIVTLMLSYWQERRTSGKITAQCAKSGIASGEATAALRQAEASLRPAEQPQRKGMAAGLIWVIVLYAIFEIMVISMFNEESSDLVLYATIFFIPGIMGTIFVHKKKNCGHVMTVLPIILVLVLGLICANHLRDGDGAIIFIMPATLFTIPYILIRKYLYSNYIFNMFGKAGKYIVYGACALLFVAAVILLSGKSYRYIGEWDVNSGMKKVQSKEGKWGFINSDDKETVPCIYDSVKCFYPNEVLTFYFWRDDDDYENKICAPACLNGKWGLIDAHNNTIIPFHFEDIDDFMYNKLAVFWKVQSGGKWGVFNEKGAEIIPCEYDAFEYSDTTRIMARRSEESLYFNKKGEKIDVEKAEPAQNNQ